MLEIWNKPKEWSKQLREDIITALHKQGYKTKAKALNVPRERHSWEE